mgnify:CR=1 FL=1
MENSKTTPSARQDNAENQENYLVETKAGVIAKLKQLIKHNCMVTATFNNGSQSISTLVLEILKDMDLVALDYGASEAMNLQLLNANRVFFKTELDGITVQFDADSITKAKLRDDPVFAIPIPSSLLWIQRREFFRVCIPIGVPAFCEVKQADGSYRKYKLFDISAGGLSLLDEYKDLDFKEGMVLSACKLELPDHGHDNVNLKIQNAFPADRSNPGAGHRIGCEFAGIGMSFGATIQRYIHTIELARRQIES